MARFATVCHSSALLSNSPTLKGLVEAINGEFRISVPSTLRCFPAGERTVPHRSTRRVLRVRVVDGRPSAISASCTRIESAKRKMRPALLVGEKIISTGSSENRLRRPPLREALALPAVASDFSLVFQDTATGTRVAPRLPAARIARAAGGEIVRQRFFRDLPRAQTVFPRGPLSMTRRPINFSSRSEPSATRSWHTWSTASSTRFGIAGRQAARVGADSRRLSKDGGESKFSSRKEER